MIKTIIEYIKKYLKDRTGYQVYPKAISKDEKMEDGLCITLLMVEPETAVRKQATFVPNPNDATKGTYKNPDLDINLYILISSHNEDYGTQLLQLSEAMRAMHNIYDFKTYTEEELKNLTANQNVREKLKELSIELQNLTAEQNNSMWQTLGATVVPAACYKVRMLTLVDTQSIESGAITHVLNVVHDNPQMSEEESKERINDVRKEANDKYNSNSNK